MQFVICISSDDVRRIDVIIVISQFPPDQCYLLNLKSQQMRSLASTDPFCSAVRDQTSGNLLHKIHKARTLGNEEAAVAFSVWLCLLLQHRTFGQVVSKRFGVPQF